MTAAAPRMLAVVAARPCDECAELERDGRDPALRRKTGSMSLYRLVGHHIEVHNAQGVEVDGCARCAEWAAPYGVRIAPHLATVWRRRHFVMHQLGLVWDGPGWPLRFADMPPPPRR